MLRALTGSLLLAATIAAARPALATEFVKNGNFSQTQNTTGSRQMSNADGSNQAVTDWYNTSGNGYAGYNFIITTDPTVRNSIDTNSNPDMSFWGKNSSDGTTATTNNGLSESFASHGNFIAADGAYQTTGFFQTITGLTVGQTYTVKFDWAGAQQYGFDGTNYEGWYVALGTDLADGNSFAVQQTGAITNVSHGFTGWQTSSYDFVAQNSTSYLAFIAGGGPNGVPPFSLLDNVSMSEKSVASVPEPASWAMMIGGFGLLGVSMRRRKPAAHLG